jgi:acylphosphatase
LNDRTDQVRAHVRVSGRVQGVYFRYATSDEAHHLAITGWVRNLPDGSVEAVFEGAAKDVEKMVAFCRTGPPRARIDAIDVEYEPWTGTFSSFGIRF